MPHPEHTENTGHLNLDPHDDNRLYLRSSEVQEILGRPPKRIVRWGITVIFLIIALLFTGSFFIKYPEILQAPVTVTTEHLPAGVAARSSGKIDTLFLREQQHVEEGSLIGVLENTARWQDVLRLKDFLKTADGDFPEAAVCEFTEAADRDFPDRTAPSGARKDGLRKGTEESVSGNGIGGMQLGSMQSAGTAYLKALEDCRYFLRTDYHRKKIRVIEKQLQTGKRILKNMEKQSLSQKKQLEIAHEIFAMDSPLYRQGLISRLEYETERNKYLQQQQSCDAAAAAADNQRLGLLQLEQEIFDLEQTRLEQENALQIALQGAKKLLLAEIDGWEQQYLLRAPCSGKVTFTTYWQKNQNVSAGEVVATVVPETRACIVGKILLPPRGAGKVRTGQTVNIKFDNFPYMEYGMVKVRIRNISLVPVQGSDGSRAYLLEVLFPEQLTTTYRKKLDFTQEMTGTAEIITDDLRLIDRFLNPIRAILYK